MKLFVFGLFILLSPLTAVAGDYKISVPLQDKGLVTYYVQGKIDGFGSTEFMVDTGSGYTTINQQTLKILKKEGKAHFVKDILGSMADGREKVFPVYKISQVVIGSHCHLQDVEVAVFPGDTRNILGMNLLKRAAPFAISVDPPQLYLSKCVSHYQQEMDRHTDYVL